MIMDEDAELTKLVKYLYGAQEVMLRRLSSATGKHIYFVEQANGQKWVLRAYSSANDDKDGSSLAAILLFLEEQQYPAERVVRAKNGDIVSMYDDWRLLITTFVEGVVTDYSPPNLRLLGAMLGRLHALRPLSPTAEAWTLPLAEMLPAPELAYALTQLTGVEKLLHKSLKARYDTLVAALHRIDCCEDLPSVIIHNDCHPGNTILTPGGQVLFIDWEGAGWGPEVIDVGFLLVSCNTAAPWMGEPFIPDMRRIPAIVDGYCQHHLLTPTELDRLPDAIRFRTIVYGACSFAADILKYGKEEETPWWWARYSAAEEIADRARERFELYLA
ncbi:MAG: hypothetical protein NVSMB27_02500 [Ktedonobacteraceae bacterium]